jgi:starvation-inducible DNA-binding protein
MEQLIEQMKIILGTNFGLYFKAHTFHWNVEGPNFAEYHNFLGTLYEAVFDQTDSIAEHIRALGSFPPT